MARSSSVLVPPWAGAVLLACVPLQLVARAALWPTLRFHLLFGFVLERFPRSRLSSCDCDRPSPPNPDNRQHPQEVREA